MDANGQRFWLLADRDHWTLLPEGVAPSAAAYDPDERVLRLASRREGIAALAPADDATRAAWRAAALERSARVASTRDDHGALAWWDGDGRRVRVRSAAGDALAILELPAERGEVTDLAAGYDEILYAAVGGGVVLRDLRDRWSPVEVRAPAMSAWRIAAEPSGGVLVLDRDGRSLWRVRGRPLPTRPHAALAPTVIRPCSENPTPPRAELLLPLTSVGGDRLAGLAVSSDGDIAVLTWDDTTGAARAHLVDLQRKSTRPVALNAALFPYSLAWTHAGTGAALAVLVPALVNEALVYPVATGNVADPVGDYYPLRRHTGDPLLNSAAHPVHYPVTADGAQPATAPLLPISATTLARSGRAQCRLPFDSGSTRTAWHRLYLEGCFPRGCGARVLLAATDTPVEPPPREGEEWHEHLFGDVAGSNPRHPAARAAWLPHPSELPFHPGFREQRSPELRRARRAGLFTALIQRPNRPVRTLRGRYLWVRVELTGDGRATPEVAAVRAYGSRFSYVERYLPELYQEQELGTDADRAFVPLERATTTRADFLERFLGIFESVLTPLEDRIAHAHLLTDARTVPEQSLEWLAGWVGLTLDPALPVERQRNLLAAAGQLAAEHGTLAGLLRALDLATGGSVRGGEVVVLEDFRLRRTMATILGVDLADEEDEMLAGLVGSGNSIVGDTLVLGDELRRDFLALFRDDFETTTGEDAAVHRLFERLAHRVTVLVHDQVEPTEWGVIRRVVSLMTPAHVEPRIVRARYPFLVGVASLVSIDTYLGPPAERTPLVLNRSRVGARDFLLRASSLDPRLSGASAPSGARLVPVPS